MTDPVSLTRNLRRSRRRRQIAAAACVAPLQIRFGSVHVSTPDCEMETVAPDHVPGLRTIVPISTAYTDYTDDTDKLLGRPCGIAHGLQ